ncbi:unnamed protein product [Closterium sp. NIES-53]
MASLRVLPFDHEGRPIQIDTWLDNLQLYLLSDSRDSVSLFDHTFGATPAPPATDDCATRSQWLTRDAAARLAIRNHLPLAECAHFRQHRTSHALYDAVVACCSSPATAALGRLLLPYLFPELSAFATVEDLVSHLCTNDARYRAALPAKFLAKNPPPMDHFLALDPTDLTVDLLEQHSLAAETSVVAVGAARGTPRTPLFEGCSPSPLAPSYAFAAAVDVLGAEDVGAASTSGKRRSSKGKGGRGGGGGSGGGGGGSSGSGGGGGGGGSGGSGGGSGGSSGGGGGSGGSGGSGSGGSGGGRIGAQRGGSGGGQRQRQQRRSETPSPQQLREWSGVAIFDLDYDAILSTMYALSASAEGDCYLCVPLDLGIEAAALGASESSLPGTTPAEALHTFTLDSGALRCFFRDSTTLTPLLPHVPVRLADPSGGPVVACSSTVLPCLAVPSGSLSGLHLPSFSMNLVSTTALQDPMVTTTTPGGPCVDLHVYTDGSSPGHGSASGQVAPPCLCRLLSHQTLLWHHRLGHPSLPHLRGMHSRLLVSGLPRSLPPSPTPPCLPCVEGRQRAAPHSSSFPLTTAPLQTLQMDVWGPTRVSGQGRERYFLLVVDDYTWYTTVLRSKDQVVDVLIPWIRVVRLQLRERFHQDLPVLRLHSDRGGEFSSDLLRDFCRGEGILQSFTLLDSPQQNGIAEHRIGLVMEPRVSLPETSPTLRWTGKVGDASVFRVWGSCALVRDTSADNLSARASPCVFLGFSPDAPGWQFYHPTSRRVFPSQDVTFDELVPFSRLFPYRSAPPPPSPLFLAPGPPPVDPLPPQGPAPSGVSQVDPLPGTAPVEVAVGSGAARGATSGGAESEGAGSGGAEHEGADPGGAEPAGVEPGGVEPEGVEPGGAESEGAESWGAEPRATGAGGPGVARDRGARVTAGAGGTGGTAAAGLGGSRTRGTGAARSGGVGGAGAGGAGDPTEPGASGDGGARAVGAGDGGTGAGGVGDGGAGAVDPGAGGGGGTTERGAAGAGGAGALGTGTGSAGAGGAGAVDVGAGGIGAGGARAGGAGAVDPGAGGAGGTVRPRPYFVPVLQQVLGVPSSTGLPPPLLCPPPNLSKPPLQPASPLPTPSPYTEQFGGLTERHEPASCPVSPFHTARRVPHLRPPAMALRPSFVPLRVPLPPPLESSLLVVPDPESDHAYATSPIISRLLATIVSDPSFESTAASSLVAELLDFAAACRLDYATSLVAESESADPPSVGGECALGTDVLEDRQEDFECLAPAVPRFASMLLAPEGDTDAPNIPTLRSNAEAITGPYSSQWQAAMDAEMTSWKSTGTYGEAAAGFSACLQGALCCSRLQSATGGRLLPDLLSPTPKMTTLWVLLHVAAQRDYKLHSLDFSTAFLQGSLHEEIWLRRPPGFTESFPTGTQWSLRRPVYGLCQGRPVQFDTWLDDLQLYLLSDIKDGVSLFDHVSGAATAPPTTPDSATRSRWLSCDAAARLAIRNHLPLAECSHFGHHRTAQALYDAVVSLYSSPATAALGRLLLPYLFPDLSSFATVEDLVSHLRTSDARYRAAVPVDAVAVGAARGTPRPPFFEGCSPSPLAPSYASTAAADVFVAEDVEAASASAKCPSGKGKGGKGGGGGSGSSGGGSSGGGSGSSGGGSSGGGSGSSCGGSSGGGGGGGIAGGSGGSGGSGGGSGGSGGGGGNGTGGGGTGARRGGSVGGQRQQQQRRSETPSPQQLREWFLRGASGGSCSYVIRTGDHAGQTCGRSHTQHRCFSRLDDAWRADFGDDVELSRWADLLKSRIAIFDLDFDAILSAMYALSVSAQGDCYRCVPPDPGTSRCFFRDSTTLTHLPAPIPVRLADPSGGPVVARSSTVLPCPAVPSGSLSSLHLPSFSTNLTLLWHRRLGHPSLPRLRGMHSRLLVSGLPRSLPPLSPSPAPPCLPCIEGRQRAAPHSSSFPPMTAPLQTLHMDVWGPARVSGQSRDRYFLLVIDDYTRYTTVFPLRSKGQVVDVLIPCIRTVRLQLREWFGQDLPVLLLHSDRGGEFSSNLLRDFCRGEGILQSFTLPDSPQQNGIAERRIGLVMEVARTSMIHAAAPHFLWSFALRYAAHQLNLWPRVSLPETSPTLRWMGEVGDASVFRVLGSRAFVCDMSADKLSPRAIPSVFLGFVPDVPGWQFYHPTLRRVFPSQDVTFDESVPFYRLFPYRSAPPLPPPLFLAPGPPPVDPLPPQGPAPSGVSQVDPLSGPARVQVAVSSGAPRGAASGGAASGGAEPGSAESDGAESGGAEPEGVATGGGEPGGAEPEGVEPGGAVSEGAESVGAEPQGAASSGGFARASSRLSAQCSYPGTGAVGTGVVEGAGAGDLTDSGATGTGATGAGGAGVGRPGAGGAGVGGPGVGGAGAVDPGGSVRPRPYFVPLLQQPTSRPVSPARTAHRVPCSRPPLVPGTHAMTLRPSSVPLRVPLPAPPESSLPKVPDPESDRARGANPTVSRLLATAVTDPSLESAAASALIAELLEFAATCHLDYASALVAESTSASPPSVGGECALGMGVLEDMQEDFECFAAAVPRFASMLLAPEGDPGAPNIPTPRSSNPSD